MCIAFAVTHSSRRRNLSRELSAERYIPHRSMKLTRKMDLGLLTCRFMAKVKVYGADWCAATRRVIAHLESNKVPFDFIDVENDREASDWVKQQNNGKEIKPTLDVDGKVLSEPTNRELDAALRL